MTADRTKSGIANSSVLITTACVSPQNSLRHLSSRDDGQTWGKTRSRRIRQGFNSFCSHNHGIGDFRDAM